MDVFDQPHVFVPLRYVILVVSVGRVCVSWNDEIYRSEIPTTVLKTIHLPYIDKMVYLDRLVLGFINLKKSYIETLYEKRFWLSIIT